MAIRHAKPGEVVDLAPLDSGLKSSKTAALVKTDYFEAIRLVVPAGNQLPEHKVSGEITLYCLEGHIELGVHPAPVTLKTNEWIYLAGGAPHSIRAIEDTSLLLMIILQPASATND